MTSTSLQGEPTAQATAEHAPSAPAITSNDAIIDFENMTAESILRRHRAIAHQVRSIPT